MRAGGARDQGQGRSAPDDIDFVEQAADLLAALQLWAKAQDRTDDDVREVVEAASGTMLKNIATELHEGGGDDALEASRRLEGIANSPSSRGCRPTASVQPQLKQLPVATSLLEPAHSPQWRSLWRHARTDLRSEGEDLRREWQSQGSRVQHMRSQRALP